MGEGLLVCLQANLVRGRFGFVVCQVLAGFDTDTQGVKERNLQGQEHRR